MTTPKDYFDVNAEPSNFPGRFAPDPSEQAVPPIDGHEDEISTVRDSVLNEPALTGQLEQSRLSEWLAAKRAHCSLGGNLAVTGLAALIGGLFAIFGVFMAGRQTVFGVLYAVLFAPIVEELLKQSGMIYLLEKKPYRIFSAWQFLLAAIISAGIFSAIENLLYIYVYTSPGEMSNPQAFASFRWTICTTLHIGCSLVASIGLIRVWKKQLAEGRAADLGLGFVPFAMAMTLHGLYNLTMVLIGP